MITIALFGGTGFLGRAIIPILVNGSCQVIVFSRHSERHRDLNVYPNVKVIPVTEIKKKPLDKKFGEISAVINLIGVLNVSDHKGVGFKKIHVELTKSLFNFAKKIKANYFIQVSALNANVEALSHYLQTKGEAQQWLLKQATENLRVFIFQPSVIFGRGDSFFNRFGRLIKIAPGFFPLPCAQSLYSPVFVGDVAQCIVESLLKETKVSRVYQMCGPKQYTLLEMVRYCSVLLNKKRYIFALTPQLSKLQAYIMEYLPGKPFSKDNYLSSLTPSVCTMPWPSWYTKKLRAIEEIVPDYLD